MNIMPIFRKVIIGAAESSLDVAGAALLPGAWPILKSALEPVLARLKERLGGIDITASPEKAQEAVAEFEADRHLQEMLRSKLVEQLDMIVKSQKKIDADIQKLLLIVTGDQKLLIELVGGVERVEQRLEEGVNLSDEAVEKLTHAVSRQAENSRQVRALALREMGPVAQLIKRQVSRLQVRAVELVDEGALDRASDELREGLMLIAALLNEAPTDISLRLNLGFIHKTLAQVFEAAGDAERAQAYIGRAEEVFRFVKDDVSGDQKTALDIANAIHGLGNVSQQKGDYKGALENYRLATSLYPNHIYALHDMFLVYYELIKQGQINIDEMRHVLNKLKQIGGGKPGLGIKKISKLESIYRYCENLYGDTEKTTQKSTKRLHTVEGISFTGIEIPSNDSLKLAGGIIEFDKYLKTLGAEYGSFPTINVQDTRSLASYDADTNEIKISVHHIEDLDLAKRAYCYRAFLEPLDEKIRNPIIKQLPTEGAALGVGSVISGFGFYFPCSFKNEAIYSLSNILDLNQHKIVYNSSVPEMKAYLILDRGERWARSLWELRKHVDSQLFDGLLLRVWNLLPKTISKFESRFTDELTRLIVDKVDSISVEKALSIFRGWEIPKLPKLDNLNKQRG